LADGASGTTVHINAITAQALQQSGHDTVVVEDATGHVVEYRVRSADQITIKYIATVVQLGATGQEAKVYCEKHPDHVAEFWNPVESTLTCALCHLLGDSKKHPCLPLTEAAQAEDSSVPLWTERATQHLEAVTQSHSTVTTTLEELETDYRRNVGQLNALEDTVRKQLEYRREEILLSIVEQ
jgi:hypothetical protein